MLDDSAQALEAKERFRQGETSFVEFSGTMDELRRTGKDRNEPKRPTAGPERARLSVAASAASLPVSTSSARDSWGPRDTPSEGRGKLGGSGKDPLTTGLKRPVSSSGVLTKLGGRLSGFTISSNTGQASSPVVVRARSSGSGGRRKSPRRGFGSPRKYAGSEPGGGGTGSGWHPWSTSRNASAGANQLSLECRGASPGDTPVTGVAGVDHGGGDGDEGAREGSVLASQPLTGSEIDNMSSISTTSTLVIDLVSRVEKIEDTLAKVVDVCTYPTRRRGRSGSNASRRARLENASSPDSGGGSGSGGSEPSSNTNEGSVDVDVLNLQQDTEEQLREVWGRLRQLTIRSESIKATGARSVSAPADAAAVVAGPRVTSAALVAGPRSPPSTLVKRKSGKFSAAAIAGSAEGGVAGGGSLRGGVPASELPAGDDDDEALEILKPAAPSSQPGSSSSGMPAVDQDGSTVASARSGAVVPSGFEREEKGEGGEHDAAEREERGRKEGASDGGGEEVRDVGLGNAPEDRESGVGVLRRERPIRLSTITELAP